MVLALVSVIVRSITAVDMNYIECYQPEGNMCLCYFYYEKGLQCGKQEYFGFLCDRKWVTSHSLFT